MSYDRFKHHRRSIRLKEYDYAGIGAYYITICTWGRGCLFGEIIDGKMIQNEFGRTVYEEWANTPVKRTNVILDVFVVMPNHMHGIFIITENRGRMATDGKPGETQCGDIPQCSDKTYDGGISRYTGKTYGENPRCTGETGGDDPRCTGEKHMENPRCRGVLQYAPTHISAPNSNGPSTETVAVPLRSPSQTVGAIVRGFKGAAAKRVNELRCAPGSPVWQRDFYERVVHNQNEFDRIRHYIVNNPINWIKDIEHPTNPGATAQIPDDICKEV